MTMLEKIARAIYPHIDSTLIDRIKSFDDMKDYPETRKWLDEIARAAVKAMREPTKEMIQQGNSEIDDHIESYNYESDWGYNLGVDAARKGWETMINVILNEKPVELASPRRAKRRR